MKNKENTISYLLKTFSCLKYHDCEDTFQDSMLVFYNKLVNGELDNIKSTLYTFFVGICKNKALEFSRKISKFGFIEDNLVCGNFSEPPLFLLSETHLLQHKAPT